MFLAAGALMLASVALIHFVGGNVLAGYQQIDAERTCEEQLQAVLSGIEAAETGQRGYLLTGNEDYLKPYQAALAQIPQQQEALRAMAAAGELPAGSVDDLIRLTQDKLAEMKRTIDARRTGGLEASLPIIRGGTGKATMDKIRTAILAMSSGETRKLQQTVDEAKVAVRRRTVVYLVVSLVNLAVLAWACRRVMHEIRVRDAAVNESARQKDLFSTTLGSIGDGVIATDAEGRVTFMNPEAERLTGWRSDEARGKPLGEVFRILNEKTRLPVGNPVDKVLRTGVVAGLANHTSLISKAGIETPIDDSGAPIRAADGSLLGVVLVFRDFTEQKKALEAKARLAAIVESSGNAIATKNLNGVVQTWNAGAERMFGYRAEEIVGKHITVIFPPERLAEEDPILERIRSGQPMEHLETVRVAKNGRRIPVSVSISPIKDAEGNVIGASKFIRDISDVVAAREALLEEKELLATTLASIGDAVIVTDADGRVTFLNAEAERLTGWHVAEAAGRPLPEVFRIVNEATRAPVESPAEKVFRLGHAVGLANHTVLIARDGREIPIDDSGAPIRHVDGRLLGVVLVFRDFTEHKKSAREIHELNAKLREQAAKLEKTVEERTAKLRDAMAELQHVSHAMVHDMRAPLRAMQAFAQMLAAESPEDTPALRQEHLRRIMTAANRLDMLVQDALNYSRVVLEEIRLHPVNLEPLLQNLIDTYPNLAPSVAEIRLDGPFGSVLGSESLLTQCFSNLLGNAVKFVAPGVRPKVHIFADPVPIRSQPGNGADSRTLRVWVQDNGIGIPKSSQPRLFGMFEKLNREYEGTGIGLAIVRKVVERMGGKVGVESEPGTGSRFWVELPLAE